ncbi:MAG: TIGR02710 family CRISPR-associated CARF protein [Methanobacteriaceae archaeon]
MDNVLFMTVGTGVGDSDKKIDSLAHGLLFSIRESNPDFVVFFGSELSRKTVKSLKEQYKEENDGKDFENFEFILINDIDSFNECYDKIKNELFNFKDSTIRIDYTSGTKTMTMTAAICSTIYRKDLILVSGTRGKDGIVLKGTEEKKTQNLYQVYDKFTLDKIKDLFNNNLFDSALLFLEEMRVIPDEQYSKLIKSYNMWDKFHHELAYENFSSEFSKDFSEIENQIAKNNKVLNILNLKEHKLRCYYILADLLNNVERRAEEGKYDDAIARLYRSLELIGQIKLKKSYKLITSNLDIEKVENIMKKSKNIKNNEQYILKLKNKKGIDGKIRIGLKDNFILLDNLENSLGIKFMENKNKFYNTLKHRNQSILAHGLNPKFELDYKEFKKLVFDLAKELEPQIEYFMKDAKFPKLNLN